MPNFNLEELLNFWEKYFEKEGEEYSEEEEELQNLKEKAPTEDDDIPKMSAAEFDEFEKTFKIYFRPEELEYIKKRVLIEDDGIPKMSASEFDEFEKKFKIYLRPDEMEYLKKKVLIKDEKPKMEEFEEWEEDLYLREKTPTQNKTPKMAALDSEESEEEEEDLYLRKKASPEIEIQRMSAFDFNEFEKSFKEYFDEKKKLQHAAKKAPVEIKIRKMSDFNFDEFEKSLKKYCQPEEELEDLEVKAPVEIEVRKMSDFDFDEFEESLKKYCQAQEGLEYLEMKAPTENKMKKRSASNNEDFKKYLTEVKMQRPAKKAKGQQYWESLLNTIDMMKSVVDYPANSTIPNVKRVSENLDELKLQVLKWMTNNETDDKKVNITKEDFSPKKAKKAPEVEEEVEDLFIYQELKNNGETNNTGKFLTEKPMNMIVKVDFAAKLLTHLLPYMHKFGNNVVALLEKNQFYAVFETRRYGDQFKRELEKKLPGIKVYVEQDDDVDIAIENLGKISLDDLEKEIQKITNTKPQIILLLEKGERMKWRVFAKLTNFGFLMLQVNHESAIRVGSHECQYKEIPK